MVKLMILMGELVATLHIHPHCPHLLHHRAGRGDLLLALPIVLMLPLILVVVDPSLPQCP